jgi:translation initiation factor IF-2
MLKPKKTSNKPVDLRSYVKKTDETVRKIAKPKAKKEPKAKVVKIAVKKAKKESPAAIGPAPSPTPTAPKKRILKPAVKKVPAPVIPKMPSPHEGEGPGEGKTSVTPSSQPSPETAAPVAIPKVEPAKPQKPKIKFNETLTVKDLAEKMGVKTPDVIKKLMGLGVLATINQRLNPESVSLLAEAFGFEADLVPIFSEETDLTQEDLKALVPRPPVVTVMGHVDHGKTSLLDAIRQTHVAAGEAGGITQHIGATQVRTPKGIITFLDTPGHEAFAAMRARGAVATDLVILVVGADDGMMPQTIEAIDHARSANVPIVVAINKVDLPTANVQKVKQQLADQNLVAEDWGGKTIMVEVSAKTRHNLDKLLEMILLEAEILELKADPQRPAKGTVLEARLDPRRGPVATILVKMGTIKEGDVFVCGFTFGKVRALINDQGTRLKNAGPSTPVELLGFSAPPQAGDHFVVVSNEREARDIAERRGILASEAARKPRRHLSLEHLHEEMRQGAVKELPLILKADVQGSLQALKDSLDKIAAANIQLRMIHAGVGSINESDVLLAEASNAVIIGFNVKAEPGAEEEAKRTGVDIRTYQIIYELLADVKAAMEGLLEPELKEVMVGRAQVKQTFRIPKGGAAAGCLVSDGKLVRGGKARIFREGKVTFEGTISGLKRFKDDVRDVEKGFECGVVIEGFQSFRPGDLIEMFQIEKRARRLEEK